jgi:hypothetical protein
MQAISRCFNIVDIRYTVLFYKELTIWCALELLLEYHGILMALFHLQQRNGISLMAKMFLTNNKKKTRSALGDIYLYTNIQYKNNKSRDYSH